MVEEKRDMDCINVSSDVGEVRIASGVVSVIAALAATEVEGVASMAGNITNELVAKLGKKNLSKGIKITMNENEVRVDIALTLKFGYNIQNVTKEVQERVMNQIENMTGLKVTNVNVRVANLAMEQED